jgi:hypothetical protein
MSIETPAVAGPADAARPRPRPPDRVNWLGATIKLFGATLAVLLAALAAVVMNLA